jgi:hypothetical protein
VLWNQYHTAFVIWLVLLVLIWRFIQGASR